MLLLHLRIDKCITHTTNSHHSTATVSICIHDGMYALKVSRMLPNYNMQKVRVMQSIEALTEVV